LAQAFGSYTYGERAPHSANRKVHLRTLFDLASCTKVVATTSATALLLQWGYLHLDTRVGAVLGPRFDRHGKSAVRVLNLLLHNAGFPPDPTPYNFWEPAFGCQDAPLPRTLSLECADRVLQAVTEQELQAPVGAVYNYSDISFITLAFVVGRVALERSLVEQRDVRPECAERPAGRGAQLVCAYEAFVRVYVFEALGMRDTTFVPPPCLWPHATPTSLPLQEGLGPVPLQGRVEDGNAQMLGGISGHAGVFASAPDLVRLLQAYMRDDRGAGDRSHATSTPELAASAAQPSPRGLVGGDDGLLLNGTTIRLMTKEYNHSQSSRALGWNTNDPGAPDSGWGLSCGSQMSTDTFMHIGYTGTMLCVDPQRAMFAILLTNRVYPSDATPGIHEVRQAFGDAAVLALQQRRVDWFGTPRR